MKKTKKTTKKKTKAVKKATRASRKKPGSKRGCSICGKPGVDRRTHPHKG